MVNYAKRLTYHVAERDPEDIVQDAYVRAWKAWSRFQPKAGEDPVACVRSWLFTIVANTFVNDFHKRKLTQRTLAQQDAVTRGMYNLDEPLEDHGDEVEAALSFLLPQFREVVERYYFQEQTFQEIARDLKISQGTVMSRMSRARAILIPRLSQYAKDQWGLAGVDASLAEASSAPQPNAAAVEAVVG